MLVVFLSPKKSHGPKKAHKRQNVAQERKKGDVQRWEKEQNRKLKEVEMKEKGKNSL